MKKILVFVVSLLSCAALTLPLESKSEPTETESNPVDYYRQSVVDSAGVNIHYWERGQGEVMLFLHGYPFYGLSWENLLRPFSASYHVVAPDNRGYNLSDKPLNVEDYQLSKLVGDVATLADKLSPNDKIILVGHDWGGALAWTFAQINPQRVSKIIVINAPPANVLLDMLKNNPQQQHASRYMDILKSGKVELAFAQSGPEMLWNYGFNRLYAAGGLSESFKRRFWEAWQQPDALKSALNWYRANIPEFEQISEVSFFPARGTRIKMPALLIWTENERTFVKDSIQKTAELADHLVVEMIMDSGHSPFLDKPEQVIAAMNKFIASNTVE